MIDNKSHTNSIKRTQAIGIGCRKSASSTNKLSGPFIQMHKPNSIANHPKVTQVGRLHGC